MTDLKGKSSWELYSKKPDREDFIQVIKVTIPGKDTQLQDELMIYNVQGGHDIISVVPLPRVCATMRKQQTSANSHEGHSTK